MEIELTHGKKVTDYGGLMKVFRRLELRLDMPPTNREVADEMGVPVQRATYLIRGLLVSGHLERNPGVPSGSVRGVRVAR